MASATIDSTGGGPENRFKRHGGSVAICGQPCRILADRRVLECNKGAVLADDATTRLIDQIAGTSLRPENWPALLENLTAFAGARGAFLIPLDKDTAGLQVTESLHGLLDDYLKDGWYTNDFRFRGKSKMLRDGITVDQDFIDADRIRREPFYDAFLRSHGLKFFAGLAITSGTASWALTLQRGLSSDPFGPEEQARLLRLVGPLQDAVRIGRALRSAYAEGTVDQLSAQDVACLLFDAVGQVTYLNKAAERLLGEVIDITHGLVRTKSRRHSLDLDRNIQIALQAPSLDGVTTSAPIFIGDPTPEHILRVTRLPRDTDSIFHKYRGMIQIRRIRRIFRIEGAVLQQAYGLTRKEVDLLQALVKHASLPIAARTIGISHETARSRIKSIFSKTNTDNQIELNLMATNFLATGDSEDARS